MRDSVVKDKILKALINKECKDSSEAIAKYLDIPNYTAYTFLKEMESNGHVETIESTTVNSPTACVVRRILPSGEHFYRKSSYKKEALKKWYRDLPTNNWILSEVIKYLVIAIAGGIVGALTTLWLRR